MLQKVFLSGQQKQFALNSLRLAACNDGCFIVKNSPFALNPYRKSVQQQLSAFYLLSEDEKIKVGKIQGRGATRGYFSIGSESGNKDLLELKESFSYGNNQIPKSFESTLVDVNKWHNSFNTEEFQSLLVSFNETANQLVELSSEALGIDLVSTTDETSKYISFIRSFKYYGSKEQNQKNQTGNSLHTDWNLLTLVWTDKPGLQFLKDDGSFQDVFDEEDDGSLICNFGDFIASLSLGKVRSPWHKVISPQIYRHSLVHFYYPSAHYPAVDKIIYQQGRPLGLFVDQSKSDGTLWNIDKNIINMEQMYSQKWKQVTRLN